MVILKKFGIVLTSSALSFGMFASIANANTSTTVMEQPEKVQIQMVSKETVFTKADLIKKLKSLFPNKFDQLSNSDFQMGGGYTYPNDDTVRYDLYFSKTINGKQLNGNVVFVGKDLEIEHFSFQPLNQKEALFPAKVSKDEAMDIAKGFMKKIVDGEEYQLESNNPLYYYSKQILTEPVRYSFSFTRTKNKVSIAEQRVEVTVLGNGEIVGLYMNPVKKNSSTFEDIKKIKESKVILDKVKENLTVDLQYQIETDYQTGEQRIQLVYLPTTKLMGVQAISGKWLTANGYTTVFPEKRKIEKITAKPLPSKNNGVTVEEAKKIAEKFLKPKSDKFKLNIHSVEEVENFSGQEVIRIGYMVNYGNGGSGASLEINKLTGEIIQYYDVMNQLLNPLGENPKQESSLTQKEALAQALKYVKQYVPSYLHNYAMPVEDAYFDEYSGSYNLTFPRVVNGIMVLGDQINVGIAADGSLNSLYVNYQEVEKWPSSDKVISEADAKAILKNSLSLKLQYMKQDIKDQHYDLVYLPVFNENIFASLDANTGKWNSLYPETNPIVIKHPWAEEELNYLISAKILEPKDNKAFNGDASVSKGEAIKVIMSSLTYFYEGMYNDQNENMNQTFENIDPKHPSYQVIERAVEAGIIKPDKKTFDLESPVTKEELAAWYIRVLGLEQAAKHSSIYKLDFADANKVQKEYTGYVAIANSMGILTTEQNQFNPAREVSYADLAVSIIPLAHAIADKGYGLRY
ncbi:S-layer homology domain-containing protein [Psychrobacillus sp. FSL H8-0483]|uniref:S-layer homology domain-containing protein n=1 Tax=Psychrobacillus sp. FSL H8-0483 TaxID=2921389 RepID=UPI00315A5E73